MSEEKAEKWADRHPNLAGVVGLCVLGGIVLSAVQGCTGGSGHAAETPSCSECATSSFGPGGPAPTPAQEPAHITFVRKGSYCEQDVLTNKVIVVASYRNTGGKGTVSPLPVREYTDGSVNRSEMDRQIDVPVPGDGKVHRFWAKYEVDADHLLTRCSIDDESGVHHVPVAAIG